MVSDSFKGDLLLFLSQGKGEVESLSLTEDCSKCTSPPFINKENNSKNKL